MMTLTNERLKRQLVVNTISSWLRTGIRLVLGVLMFRMLYPKPDAAGNYSGLTPEEFGFWALLWSVLGYGILLDFGLGYAAQKRVAEYSVSKDRGRLTRVLSTIFYFYFVGAAVIIGGTLLTSHWLIDLFHVSAANREPFRQILVLFLTFVGLAFPIGISVEILCGQQRVALANNLASTAAVASFALVALALHLHWGLKVIFLTALMSNLVPTLIGGWLGLRAMPGVKVLPRYVSWATARDTMRFSTFAYVGIVTNLIMSQTDRVVLGMMLSVSAVTIYQAGAKVAETLALVTAQLPAAVSPAAAHLHATGDDAALRRLLLEGTRFNVMIATPLFLLCALYMEVWLAVLTKGEATSGATYWTGQALLLWCYTTIITHSITKAVFFMSGHEKLLAKVSMAEAGANLLLSVTLVRVFQSVVAVAVGSLVPSVVIGWHFLFPWAARHVGLTSKQLAREVLYRSWLGCVPLLLFATICRLVPWADTHLVGMPRLAESMLAGAIGAVGMWRFTFSGRERAMLSEMFAGVVAGVVGREGR